MRPRQKQLSATISKDIQDTLVTFLQDFGSAMATGSRQAAAVSAARVAQLGLSVFETFGSGCEAICLNDEDRLACQAAAQVVRDVMEKRLDEWYNAAKSDKEKAYLSIN